MGRIAALLLCAGCAPSVESIYVDPPGDEPAVLIVTDTSGRVLAPTPLLLSSNPVRFAVEVPEIIVRVQTFAKLARRELGGCRINLDVGQELGAPKQGWSSGVVASGGAIQLAIEDPPEEFPLLISGCTPPPPKSCEVITHGVQTPVTYRGLMAVAALSDDEMLAIGQIRGETDLRTLFMHGLGASATEIGPYDRITGYGQALENDGAGIIGGADSTVFRMSYVGQVLSSSVVGFTVAHLDSGRDGSTVVVGRFGDLLISSRGNLDLRRIPTPDYQPIDLPDEPRVAVRDADHYTLYGPDNRIYDWDGAWHELLEGSMDGLATDDRYIYAIPAMGAALRYDRTTQSWETFGDNIFQSQRPKAVVPYGDGRFVVVGQTGLAAYYNGEQFCLISTGVLEHLNDVDLAPSARAAWAVGNNVDLLTEPVVVRFDLP